MKRLIVLSSLVILCSSVSLAQMGISWGLGPNVSFPSSDFGDQASTGFGGTGLVKFGIIPLIDVTGGLEYISFGSMDSDAGSLCTTAWGYLVGGRVNVFVMAYAGLELGAYTFSSTFTTPDFPDIDASATEFAVAPMIGVNLGQFDAAVRYIAAGDANFISLRGLVWF